MKYLVLVSSILLSVNAFAAVEKFEIDPSHSTVAFKVRHLISKTTGKFEQFSGTVQFDESDLKTLSAVSAIEIASVNTNDKKRDDHLKSGDFFDASKFPKMEFKSGKVLSVKGKKAKVEGTLSLHGVTKPVTLDVEFTGRATDPWGNNKVGFTAKTKIDRKDFGITWNKKLDAGGFVIGDEVEIELEVEANLAKK